VNVAGSALMHSQSAGHRLNTGRPHDLDGSWNFTGDVKVKGINPYGRCNRFSQAAQ
jgi:hypothetical protein